MFIDTHTHLYTEEFDDDRSDVIARAVAAGAEALLLPNIDEASIAPMLALHDAYPGLCFPMMGLHPTELPADPAPLLQRMEALLSAEGLPYVAIGEVGIDLYWDTSRRTEQMAVFRQQAEWAIRYDLPLVVHCRSGHQELLEAIGSLADKLPSGVFHCFGGTAAEARELLSTFPQFVLGIGGVVTFKKSTLPQVLAEVVPLNRIVVETDAPYLSPTPHRGKRNEPTFIPLIMAKIAEIYACSIDEVAHQTTATARRIFPRISSH